MSVRGDLRLLLKELVVAGATVENAGLLLLVQLGDKKTYLQVENDVCYLVGGPAMDDKIPYRHIQILEREIKKRLGI